LGEINTPSRVAPVNLVDDEAVDATLGDAALKEANASKADTEQMPVQAMEAPIAVVDITDSTNGGDDEL
jgi:hypothetical protein